MLTSVAPSRLFAAFALAEETPWWHSVKVCYVREGISRHVVEGLGDEEETRRR